MGDSSSVEVGIKKIDSSGRLNLGKSKANEIYAIAQQEDGTIVLTPVAIIPKRELWVWQNPEVLAAIQEGLRQSARGEVHDLGSFAQYFEDDDEE